MSMITKFLNGSGAYFSFTRHSLGEGGSDVIALLIIFAVCFGYALYFGKNRAISLSISFFVAEYFFGHFPFMKSLLVLTGEIPLLLNNIGIFLLFLIPVDIVINKFIFQDSGYGTAHYLRIGGYAVLLTILVLIFSYSVVSLDLIHNFSGSIDNLFNAPDRLFFWHLAPFILLFVL